MSTGSHADLYKESTSDLIEDEYVAPEYSPESIEALHELEIRRTEAWEKFRFSQAIVKDLTYQDYKHAVALHNWAACWLDLNAE